MSDAVERRGVVFREVSAMAPMHNREFGVACGGILRARERFSPKEDIGTICKYGGKEKVFFDFGRPTA